MRVVGIDPGVSGAVALYLPKEKPFTSNQGLVDLPVMGDGKQSELNYAGLRDILFLMRPDVVFIERVTAMPSMPGKPGPNGEPGADRRSMGAASAFKFGGGFYAIKAVCACLDLDYRLIMPAQWKKHYGLTGGDGAKERARLTAITRYPAIESYLKRKKDHQRAEAFLLAVYGAYKLGLGDAPSLSEVPSFGDDMDEDIPF